ASLNNSLCIITGASGGIGSGIALCMAKEGAQLCLVGRNPVNLESVAQGVRRYSSQVRVYRADISDDNDLNKLADTLRADCNRLDVLVHCAGIIAVAPFETALAEDFDRQYRTNVRAPYVLTQALLPLLRATRGSVVFINSS